MAMVLGNPTVQLILKAIEQGFDTVPKISEQTGINDLTVAKCLQRLAAEDIVRRNGKDEINRPGSRPTIWVLGGEKSIILKKYTQIHCVNNHLYCVVLKDIQVSDLFWCDEIEFSRDQGKLTFEDPLLCNICKGSLKIPK